MNSAKTITASMGRTRRPEDTIFIKGINQNKGMLAMGKIMSNDHKPFQPISFRRLIVCVSNSARLAILVIMPKNMDKQ